MNKKNQIYSSIILGILFIIPTFIYFTHAANTLPHFFPGYDATLTKIHFKHGIATLVLALGSFAYAWFKSGEKESKYKYNPRYNSEQ